MGFGSFFNGKIAEVPSFSGNFPQISIFANLSKDVIK